MLDHVGSCQSEWKVLISYLGKHNAEKRKDIFYQGLMTVHALVRIPSTY